MDDLVEDIWYGVFSPLVLSTHPVHILSEGGRKLAVLGSAPDMHLPTRTVH